MNAPHLSDDLLVEHSLGCPGSARDEEHLAACPACQAKQAALTSMLDEISLGLNDAADAAFPQDRLARQRGRILQRVAQLGRPAKVIAFPAGSEVTAAPLGWRPTTRWVAAAALAGLVVGLLADQALTHLPGSPRRLARTDGMQVQTRTQAVAPAIRPIGTTESDDEFLGQIEAAVGSGGPLALRPLDMMTPRAWDVSR